MLDVEKKLQKELSRNQFSDYLAPVAYDQDKKQFITQDGAFAIGYECTPPYFAGNDTINIISAVLKQDFVAGATMQFILLADTNINHYCNMFASKDKIQSELTKKIAKNHINYIKTPELYKQKLKGNKIKNFRLFVLLKTKKEVDEINIIAFEESLTSAKLQPTKMNANHLLSLLRQFFTGLKSDQTNYDNNKPINKQVILADTDIDCSPKEYIKIDNGCVAVITPKAYPQQEINILDFNELAGCYGGGLYDLEQVPSGFMICCNVILDKVDSEIARKYQLANVQRSAARISSKIGNRIEQLGKADKNLASGHYLKFIPSIVVFADNKKEMSISVSRIKTLFQRKGFLMQVETKIKQIMFLASLPFGLYRGKKDINITTIDRHFIASAEEVATQIPIQGDFTGCGFMVPFIGRKGQVSGLDLFAPGVNNHNFLCCATSGSGKSFLINWFITNYLADGAKIRINDIGGSYRKITTLYYGSYIDISKKNNVNLNPFQPRSVLDDEDTAHNIDTIKNIIGQMCYADTGQSLTDSESNLLRHAIKDTIFRGDIEFGIESVQDYLTNEKKQSGEIAQNKELVKAAKQMSFNLCEFGRKGQYGHFFNGLKENSWQDDQLVVLEMEGLKKYPSLMSVVSLAVINEMTQEMYLGDRSTKQINIFDEVALMFNSSDRLKKLVGEGYRSARKCRGSFGTVFQSVMDTRLFGDVGDVMMANAAFKFFLESTAYQQAIDQKILNYEGLQKKLLLSVKSNKPHYSEIFADTPFGAGIMRLLSSPFGVAVATTDAEDVVQVEQYQKQGLTMIESLERLAEQK